MLCLVWVTRNEWLTEHCRRKNTGKWSKWTQHCLRIEERVMVRALFIFELSVIEWHVWVQKRLSLWPKNRSKLYWFVLKQKGKPVGYWIEPTTFYLRWFISPRVKCENADSVLPLLIFSIASSHIFTCFQLNYYFAFFFSLSLSPVETFTYSFTLISAQVDFFTGKIIIRYDIMQPSIKK